MVMLDDKARFNLGKCIRMCPIVEIKTRELQRSLNILETNRRTEKAVFNSCIKCYNRSGAGEKQNFDLIRPPHICRKVVSWMFTTLIDQLKYDFSDLYVFFHDRLRSLFKDLRVQHCYNHHFAFLVRISIRFRILSHFLLKDSRCDNNLYWSRLNEEQLISHFKQLNQLDVDSKGNYDLSKKEMLLLEMAFEIGYNLNNKYIFHGNALKKWMSQPKSIRNDPDVKNMVILIKAIFFSNYIKYLQMYKMLPLLVKTILWRTLPQILLQFIKQLILTSNSKSKISRIKMCRLNNERFKKYLEKYKLNLIHPIILNTNGITFQIPHSLIRNVFLKSYSDVCFYGIKKIKKERLYHKNNCIIGKNRISSYFSMLSNLRSNSLNSKIALLNQKKKKIKDKETKLSKKRERKTSLKDLNMLKMLKRNSKFYSIILNPIRYKKKI